LVNIDPETGKITVNSGSDSITYYDEIGIHTLNFLATTQSGATIDADTKKYVVTLTYDHTSCASFSRTFTDSGASTITLGTRTDIDTTTGTWPVAVNHPALDDDQSATAFCKIVWDDELTVMDNTYDVTDVGLSFE